MLIDRPGALRLALSCRSLILGDSLVVGEALCESDEPPDPTVPGLTSPSRSDGESEGTGTR